MKPNTDKPKVSETKAGTKPEAKPPLLAKKPLDLTPQIATRAYELYEQRVRGEDQADQDWLEAEREIRKDQVGQAKAAPGSS